LITYPDQFQEPGTPPLRTLRRFVVENAGWLSGVHVLPFYPWSSDDGFSVTDYAAVEARYGTWQDIAAIASDRRLIVDAVINHMSVQGEWFRRFLAGDEEFRGFFRTGDPEADLSTVVRPRTTPLLTPFPSAAGTEWVWTTFSADQADLDYRNPSVLLAILEILLGYASHGASVIRLDAIGLLWKEEGTSSMHLPQTHWVIQLIRSCLDTAFGGTLILTETNVPHAENVSYFGDGSVAEAHLVYQFALAPLTLHALLTGDASVLKSWAADAAVAPPAMSFLNFLASHDGVGVRPAEGLLPPEAIAALADHSKSAGGGVGERSLADGSVAPYELHCTWFDLVGHGFTEDEAIARHLATHAVLLALGGIPAIYVHSLFGSSNDHEGFAATGRGRTLNRHKFVEVDELVTRLSHPDSREARVFAGLSEMVARRTAHPAFHPEAAQRIAESPPAVLAVERQAADGLRAAVIVNLGADAVDYSLPGDWVDNATALPPSPSLPPWSAVWLHASG
jgi:sucrose phosphorylase